jgi:hypothetical protein
VQLLQDTAVALRREVVELARGASGGFGTLLLFGCPLFVRHLIQGCEGTAIDQPWLKAWLVGGKGGQDVDAEIGGHKEGGISVGRRGLAVASRWETTSTTSWSPLGTMLT